MPNHASYEPSETEIHERAKVVRLLRELDWDRSTVAEIFYYGMPEPTTVKRLIETHGFQGAYDRIRRFNRWPL